MLDGKPLPSTASVWVWEKGEGGRVAQSLVHGLLLPKDVHTFKDGTDESSAAVAHYCGYSELPIPFPILSYFIFILFMYIYFLLFILNVLSL